MTGSYCKSFPDLVNGIHIFKKYSEVSISNFQILSITAVVKFQDGLHFPIKTWPKKYFHHIPEYPKFKGQGLKSNFYPKRRLHGTLWPKNLILTGLKNINESKIFTQYLSVPNETEVN